MSGTRRAATRIQVAAAVVLVVLAFAGVAAAQVSAAMAEPAPTATTTDAVVTTAASTTVVAAPEPAPARFTIGDLAAGRVPQDVQDRFWRSQLDAILAAPCPPANAPGATTVTLYLGADEAWTGRLTEAAAERRAACAG